jgi:hypothetical protein
MNHNLASQLVAEHQATLAQLKGARADRADRADRKAAAAPAFRSARTRRLVFGRRAHVTA